MRQREWVASTFGDCPVREEIIGLLYRSSQHHVQEFVSGLSPQQRASLAAFCYGRAHLHDIGLTIAATCEFEELVSAAGGAGYFLFEQSRELSSDGKPISFSKQMDVWHAELRPHDSRIQRLYDRRSTSQRPSPTLRRVEAMSQQLVAIVVASALIVAASALTNYWVRDRPAVLRMDRWTGRVLFCAGDREPGPGWIMSCSLEGSSTRLEARAR
jgi:hypothetical protein